MTAVWLAVGLCVLLAHGSAGAQDLAAFEENVTVEKLDNGLTVIVYERPTAPVVSFFTHVNVGSAQEVPGITGLAHMFEHMAFKGTSVIGTNNFKAEKKALEAVDAAYHALADRAARPDDGDEAKIEQLKDGPQGGTGSGRRVRRKPTSSARSSTAPAVSASTPSPTPTAPGISSPCRPTRSSCGPTSNRSGSSTRSSASSTWSGTWSRKSAACAPRASLIGRLIEQFTAISFEAHPYRQPVVGYMSDLQSFTREDANDFLRQALRAREHDHRHGG